MSLGSIVGLAPPLERQTKRGGLSNTVSTCVNNGFGRHAFIEAGPGPKQALPTFARRISFLGLSQGR